VVTLTVLIAILSKGKSMLNQTNDGSNNINAYNSIIIKNNNLKNNDMQFVTKSKSDQLAIENEKYFKSRFGFVVSEEKRKVLINIFNDWQLTSQELKVLYLNHFISFSKNNDAHIKRFPFLFWANSLFMLLNFIVLSVFLCFIIIASKGGLLMSFYTIGSAILISLILLDSQKNMLNPIKIISSKYNFN